MLKIRFDVAGEAQYDRAFSAYDTGLLDMRQPLGDIADNLVHVVGEQFLTEGAHGGTPWQPLNPDYERWKDEHYPGHPILVRTGAMREAFLVHGTRELTSDTLIWGVTDQMTRDDDGKPLRIATYARAHQTGHGVVPQRKIVALSSMDRRGWDRIFVEWLHEVKHRSFGR